MDKKSDSFSNTCCSDATSCSPDPMGRRDFIKASGLTAAMLMVGRTKVMAGPFKAEDLDSIIPADKKLSPDWIASLYARGEALSATGDDLKFIGMPINGICTGQVYLGGDGRLWYWNLDATKDKKNNPKGARYMHPDEAQSPVGQGFALQVGGNVHTLDSHGFNEVRFTNHYPMAKVNYADDSCPVTVQLEAYTPFIPLNRDESSYPVIVMRYTLTNTDSTAQDVSIAGWIENISNRQSAKRAKGQAAKGQKVTVYREHDNLTTVECSAKFQNAAMEDQPDHCSMALGILGKERPELVGLEKSQPDAKGIFSSDAGAKEGEHSEQDFKQPAFASLGRKLTLAPGESQAVSFAVSWCFPLVQYGVNFGPKGVALGRNHYATLWPTAAKASEQLARREKELYDTTKAWVDTWYDSTLPYWFLERSFIPIDCVQTQMGQRVFPKGSDTEIYNFEEGVRCCPGNCTHVWHYAQGLARIFPIIECENRDKIEYGLGFDAKTGAISHRYMGGRFGEAIDGNCGTILRVLRESQMTTDYRFLTSIWDRVKLSMDHVIQKWDPEEDGMLAGAQHNTLDEPWFGQVHWLINLYHAALKASAVMARQMKQPATAERYERIVEKGAPAMVDLLWNEEFGYFIHKPGDADSEKHGSTNGCHIDQVLGDSWLHNVGIDPILPQDKIRKSLHALWKYNFTPNVGAFRKVMTNGRWYAAAGDAGLVMCSFPNGKIDPKSGKASYAGYLNECMTGFEWQVSAHMIWEGMVEKGMAIGKAIYDRYQPEVRNPYNEVECSDHYSRAMACYGAYLAACGYRYDGPEGKLAFGPRLSPEKFRAAFTAAEGWGRFHQSVKGGRQENTIELRYGKLHLKQLALDSAPGTQAGKVAITLDGRQLDVRSQNDGPRTVIQFPTGMNMAAGQILNVQHG
ncbi:GH116 family glycosyl-hydrolase [Adhaeretor mobilis]|uniref:Glucosylceramidase n=1 Tax=Adhaeretor mobilis TaxID=1930276 RepID=A0A517N1H0_9BACT|nr:GH116 family glycosyl-hydrolase [Adhaeretor mobilis]QDT00982.1 hypothetical protein HG15A2_43240 [Adhaeretor mobilis]